VTNACTEWLPHQSPVVKTGLCWKTDRIKQKALRRFFETGEKRVGLIRIP